MSVTAVMTQQDPTCYAAIERMLYSVAARVMPRLAVLDPSMDIEEVVCQFSEVYCKAKQGFDPSKGIKFSTYLMQACFWEVNRTLKRLEQERTVVDATSVDSYWGIDEDESPIDRFFGSQDEAHEDVLVAREELVDRLKGLSLNARRVVALLLRPTPELREYCAARRRADQTEETPVELICKFLGLTFAQAEALRLEFRKFGGKDRYGNPVVEFTRINPRIYAAIR